MREIEERGRGHEEPEERGMGHGARGTEIEERGTGHGAMRASPGFAG